MTVELIPNCDHCHVMSVANGTFFKMVNSSGMDEIIGRQTTNDELIVSNNDALLLLTKLKKWTPPIDWGSGLKAGKMKEYFIDFFRLCDGFRTI